MQVLVGGSCVGSVPESRAPVPKPVTAHFHARFPAPFPTECYQQAMNTVKSGVSFLNPCDKDN